jgi:hypothetical protein
VKNLFVPLPCSELSLYSGFDSSKSCLASLVVSYDCKQTCIANSGAAAAMVLVKNPILEFLLSFKLQ